MGLVLLRRLFILGFAAIAVGWSANAAADRAVVLYIYVSPGDSDSLRQAAVDEAFRNWTYTHFLEAGDSFYAGFPGWINPRFQEKLTLGFPGGVPKLSITGVQGEFGFRATDGPPNFGGNCPMPGSTTVETGYWQSYTVEINGVSEAGSVWISTGVAIVSPESMSGYESCFEV